MNTRLLWVATYRYYRSRRGMGIKSHLIDGMSPANFMDASTKRLFHEMLIQVRAINTRVDGINNERTKYHASRVKRILEEGGSKEWVRGQVSDSLRDLYYAW